MRACRVREGALLTEVQLMDRDEHRWIWGFIEVMDARSFFGQISRSALPIEEVSVG